MQPLSYLRGMATDESDFDFVMQTFAQSGGGAGFQYNLTIQNHGGYTQPGMESEIVIEGAEGLYPQAEQYFTLISKSDSALEQLLAAFETVSRPVVVMMFGDHWGAVEEEYVERLFGKPVAELSPEEEMARHTTPLLLWANYDVDFSALPATVSSNYLSVLLKTALGLPLTTFDTVVNAAMKQYPVVSYYGYKDSAGNYYSAMPEEAQSLLGVYAQMQYNGLIDYRNRDESLFGYG